MTITISKKSTWSHEDGEWHYCSECRARWSDCDGGCECAICEKCKKVVKDSDDLDENGLCQNCVKVLEDDNGL